MSKNDQRLEMELEALSWRESKSMWVPKNEIPNRVITSLEEHHDKFHGEEFDYYLTSGVINKYSTSGDSANYQPRQANEFKWDPNRKKPFVQSAVCRWTKNIVGSTTTSNITSSVRSTTVESISLRLPRLRTFVVGKAQTLASG